MWIKYQDNLINTANCGSIRIPSSFEFPSADAQQKAFELIVKRLQKGAQEVLDLDLELG